MSQNEIIERLSLKELFDPLIKDVVSESSFDLDDHGHAYVLSVLERYMFTEILFTPQCVEPMVSEVLLKALQEEKVQEKRRQLKFLGDSILFRSGFFAESFRRKLVGIGYYIDMGSVAYHNLYKSSKNPVHQDLSQRLVGYVDLFSDLRAKMNFNSEEDLIVLFDKYLDGGSDRAAGRLIELGAVPAQQKKASGQ